MVSFDLHSQDPEVNRFTKTINHVWRDMGVWGIFSFPKPNYYRILLTATWNYPWCSLYWTMELWKSWSKIKSKKNIVCKLELLHYNTLPFLDVSHSAPPLMSAASFLTDELFQGAGRAAVSRHSCCVCQLNLGRATWGAGKKLSRSCSGKERKSLLS